jgi:hypothetical protein
VIGLSFGLEWVLPAPKMDGWWANRRLTYKARAGEQCIVQAIGALMPPQPRLPTGSSSGSPFL